MHDNRGYELVVTRYKIFHTANGLTYYGMGFHKKPDSFGTRTNMIGFKYLFNDELLDKTFNYDPQQNERWVWNSLRKVWVIER